jgi:hypothetical protein
MKLHGPCRLRLKLKKKSRLRNVRCTLPWSSLTVQRKSVKIKLHQNSNSVTYEGLKRQLHNTQGTWQNQSTVAIYRRETPSVKTGHYNTDSHTSQCCHISKYYHLSIMNKNMSAQQSLHVTITQYQISPNSVTKRTDRRIKSLLYAPTSAQSTNNKQYR